MLTSRVPSFRDISSSNQIFRSASTTSDSSGSRMKPSWPGRQTGSWPATLRARSLRSRSSPSTGSAPHSGAGHGVRSHLREGRHKRARIPGACVLVTLHFGQLLVIVDAGTREVLGWRKDEDTVAGGLMH